MIPPGDGAITEDEFVGGCKSDGSFLKVSNVKAVINVVDAMDVIDLINLINEFVRGFKAVNVMDVMNTVVMYAKQ